MSVDLKDFFAAYDIDSLRERILAEEHIDIQGVYCLHTGKRMGSYDADEILAAIEEIGTDDTDLLVDDLLVRVVASMRPSPALNMPNRQTLNQMVLTRPVDAFAYLANRLLGTRDLLVKRDDSRFGPLLGRIKLYAHWSALVAAGVDLTPWVHHMLEIDAKMNLHDVDGPAILEGEKGWLLSKHGTPLLTLVTLENHEAMLKLFESWAFEQLALYDERDRRLLREGNWMRGNSLASPAFARSWLENPEIANRRHAEARAKKDKAKNRTGRPAVSEKTLRQNAEVQQFMHLLDAVFDGEIAAPTPVKKPQVMTGGMLKLNLAKKGA